MRELQKGKMYHRSFSSHFEKVIWTGYFKFSNQTIKFKYLFTFIDRRIKMSASSGASENIMSDFYAYIIFRKM